jgi:hypothetical protein
MRRITIVAPREMETALLDDLAMLRPTQLMAIPGRAIALPLGDKHAAGDDSRAYIIAIATPAASARILAHLRREIVRRSDICVTIDPVDVLGGEPAHRRSLHAAPDPSGDEVADDAAEAEQRRTRASAHT